MLLLIYLFFLVARIKFSCLPGKVLNISLAAQALVLNPFQMSLCSCASEPSFWESVSNSPSFWEPIKGSLSFWEPISNTFSLGFCIKDQQTCNQALLKAYQFWTPHFPTPYTCLFWYIMFYKHSLSFPSKQQIQLLVSGTLVGVCLCICWQVTFLIRGCREENIAFSPYLPKFSPDTRLASTLN